MPRSRPWSSLQCLESTISSLQYWQNPEIQGSRTFWLLAQGFYQLCWQQHPCYPCYLSTSYPGTIRRQLLMACMVKPRSNFKPHGERMGLHPLMGYDAIILNRFIFVHRVPSCDAWLTACRTWMEVHFSIGELSEAKETAQEALKYYKEVPGIETACYLWMLPRTEKIDGGPTTRLVFFLIFLGLSQDNSTYLACQTWQSNQPLVNSFQTYSYWVAAKPITMISKLPRATTEALKWYPTCRGQDVAQGRAYELPTGQGEGTCCQTEVYNLRRHSQSCWQWHRRFLSANKGRNQRRTFKYKLKFYSPLLPLMVSLLIIIKLHAF